MKPIYFIIVLNLLLFPAFLDIHAQQVLAGSGGTLQNASGTLSFTLGELVIDTKTNINGIITQGFHQTKLTVTAINDLSKSNLDIIAYPNPAIDVVYVKVEKGNTKKFCYSLLDSNGKLLFKNSTELSEAEISLEKFNPAIYFLKITVDGKEYQTFKIIKLK